MSRVTRLEQFADKDPSNPILLCDLLDELLTEGRVDDAWARLRSAQPDLRALSGVRFREARCAMMRQDPAGAVSILHSLLQESPDAVPGIRHDLAYAQLGLGLPDEAWKTLAAVHVTGDDGVAIALLKARILHRQRRYDAALEVLAPVSSDSRMAEVHGLRALLLLDLGEAAFASAEATQALDADPEQYEAGLAAGTVALWARDIESSTTTFQKLLANHPDSGRALLGLGENLMLQGDIPAARSVLNRASVAMADHIGTWHALAWCQLLEGDLAGAKHDFDRAFALDRTFGETHGGLALVHALRGERMEAEESIKRATRLDPAGFSAKYAKSVLLLDEGHPEEARRIVDDLLAKPAGHAMHVSMDFIYKLRESVRPRG
jgi:tetratricopeptide (TPR) repeat protein